MKVRPERIRSEFFVLKATSSLSRRYPLLPLQPRSLVSCEAFSNSNAQSKRAHVRPMAVSRRLVAVFAADVEGYSRPMGADEVGTLKGLTERRAGRKLAR
jgi:class 3 adenylate cyclase